MKFPKEFLWGSATADFQYEGGFNEGSRGTLTTDYVTDGSYENPRQITIKLKDGTLTTVENKTSLPEGSVAWFHES